MIILYFDFVVLLARMHAESNASSATARPDAMPIDFLEIADNYSKLQAKFKEVKEIFMLRASKQPRHFRPQRATNVAYCLSSTSGEKLESSIFLYWYPTEIPFDFKFLSDNVNYIASDIRDELG